VSIPLTTGCLSIQDLSQSEKHALMVLCFLSNQHNEVYRSIKKLSLDCSCSIKTIERILKKLRDSGYLEYTNKIAPKSKNIPIYRINLNHGQFGGGKDLTTDNQDSNHGQLGNLTTPQMGIRKDNNKKDNNKDNAFFLKPSEPEKCEVKFCLEKGFDIPDRLQHVYLWLVENGYIKDTNNTQNPTITKPK
jgi:hypothetical protein